MIAVAGRRRRRRRRRAAAPLATENKVPANVSVQHMGKLSTVSKWNFLPEKEMPSWDVAFVVKDRRFYAHRLKMFNGAFREKHEKEVTLKDVEPDLFEAFLHCVYPCGSDLPERYLLPLTYLADKYGVEALALKCHEALKWTRHVTNIDKLLVAAKTSAPALENHVIESLTAEDIKELVGTDAMKELGDEFWQRS
ncbi:BTB/POZ and MATH domain-containing protein 4-like protein [Aphelenchoides avenae]|nr:BTB/POZ and MATH domain-containing protein 4-like protein [Aphelenchus avenae]